MILERAKMILACAGMRLERSKETLDHPRMILAGSK